MKSKEIEELLYVLKHIVIGRATRLTCKEADKLLSYIEQLENNIDKAIECIEKQKKKMYKSRNKIALFILMKLENILKGDSDDK